MRASTCHPEVKHYGRGLCRKCYSREWFAKTNYHATWVRANPEKVREYRLRHRKKNREGLRALERRCRMRRLYGLSPERYEAMLASQAGRCAICTKTSTKIRLAVDHDHKTGRIRALLCNHCNYLVGILEGRRPLFEKASEYLRTYGELAA